jgi:hypothetical protein
MGKWKHRYLESNATFDTFFISQPSRNFEYLNGFFKAQKKKWKTPLDVEAPYLRKDKYEKATGENSKRPDEIKRYSGLKIWKKSYFMFD